MINFRKKTYFDEIEYSMVYSTNTFAVGTLSFLTLFKLKKQQQGIYFRKFHIEKLWQNVEIKRAQG